MSAHTKGPWHAKVSAIVDGWKGDKQTIAIYSDSVLIAAYETNYIEHPDSNEENEANARLMSAAPDLLESLQAVEFGNDGLCRMCSGWMVSENGCTKHAHTKDCAVAKAIGKATGSNV